MIGWGPAKKAVYTVNVETPPRTCLTRSYKVGPNEMIAVGPPKIDKRSSALIVYDDVHFSADDSDSAFRVVITSVPSDVANRPQQELQLS